MPLRNSKIFCQYYLIIIRVSLSSNVIAYSLLLQWCWQFHTTNNTVVVSNGAAWKYFHKLSKIKYKVLKIGCRLQFQYHFLFLHQQFNHLLQNNSTLCVTGSHISIKAGKYIKKDMRQISCIFEAITDQMFHRCFIVSQKKPLYATLKNEKDVIFPKSFGIVKLHNQVKEYDV